MTDSIDTYAGCQTVAKSHHLAAEIVSTFVNLAVQ